MGDNKESGFTLIEISIVLVIIGLIAGSILVGRDLINAAAIRAQVILSTPKSMTVSLKAERSSPNMRVLMPEQIPRLSGPKAGYTMKALPMAFRQHKKTT